MPKIEERAHADELLGDWPTPSDVEQRIRDLRGEPGRRDVWIARARVALAAGFWIWMTGYAVSLWIPRS